MNHLNPNCTNSFRRYKFVLFFFLVQIVFANITMAQNRRIIVGVLENWPPQYMTDPETKEPTGFAVDIIRAVGRLSGLEIKYEVFKEWPVLNQALREKKIDVIPNMGIIAEREKFFDYTMPVETTKILFFVRETSNDINSEKDLAGRAISVVETNKGRFLMEERGWGNLKIYQSFDEALMSLLSGISDGFVYPDPPIMNILQQYGLSDRIKVVGEPLLEVKRAIAVHRDHSDLVNKLNDSVKVLMSSAEYKEIYSRWYGKEAPFWSVKRVAVVMGIFISIIGLALLAWRFYSVMKLNNSLLVQTQKRSQAEESLQKSVERSQTILQTAIDGFWLVDTQGHLLESNESYCRMSGYNTQELRAMCISDLEAVEAAADTAARIQKVIEKGEDRFESRHRRKDGTIFDVEVSVQYLPIEGGRIIAFLRDITERKQTETALRQQAEALRASNTELEQFNRAMVGRELRMIELKEEIDALCHRLCEPPRYGNKKVATDREVK